KDMAAFLGSLDAKNSLMVFDGAGDMVFRASKNLKGTKLVPSKDINVIDVINHEWLLLDKEAVINMEKRYTIK
ncbi:MAG: 50S ribosomal protein L4, partial [Candidatus Margulisiibacteriota bacterium]